MGAARFDLERRGDGGLRVELPRAEATVEGKVSRRTQASTALSVPAQARYLRVFFRSWSVSQDRKLALLATPERGLLEVATRQFEANPERFCQAPEPAGTFCVALPTDTALSAELKAQANGRLPDGLRQMALARPARAEEERMQRPSQPPQDEDFCGICRRGAA